jgi:hypothetical protein
MRVGQAHQVQATSMPPISLKVASIPEQGEPKPPDQADPGDSADASQGDERGDDGLVPNGTRPCIRGSC